jgi:phosphatidylglycerophosphate synthase
MAGGATPLFPLIRQISKRVTPFLLLTPLTANQLTLISLVLGCGAAWMLMQGTQVAVWQGAILLFGAYVLDNCDGEVARARGQASPFGAAFDDVADWLVNTLFFVGLGYGYADFTGERIWWWLGIAAGAGGTCNYFLAQWFKFRDRRAALEVDADDDIDEDADETSPTTLGGWLIFAFRELARADFCFLVLILAALDGLWLLLPAGAIGAQVYWMMSFVREARRYHV